MNSLSSLWRQKKCIECRQKHAVRFMDRKPNSTEWIEKRRPPFAPDGRRSKD